MERDEEEQSLAAGFMKYVQICAQSFGSGATHGKSKSTKCRKAAKKSVTWNNHCTHTEKSTAHDRINPVGSKKIPKKSFVYCANRGFLFVMFSEQMECFRTQMRKKRKQTD